MITRARMGFGLGGGGYFKVERHAPLLNMRFGQCIWLGICCYIPLFNARLMICMRIDTLGMRTDEQMNLIVVQCVDIDFTFFILYRWHFRYP